MYPPSPLGSPVPSLGGLSRGWCTKRQVLGTLDPARPVKGLRLLWGPLTSTAGVHTSAVPRVRWHPTLPGGHSHLPGPHMGNQTPQLGPSTPYLPQLGVSRVTRVCAPGHDPGSTSARRLACTSPGWGSTRRCSSRPPWWASSSSSTAVPPWTRTSPGGCSPAHGFGVLGGLGNVDSGLCTRRTLCTRTPRTHHVWGLKAENGLCMAV